MKRTHCQNCDKLLTGSSKKYCNGKCQHQYQNDQKISRWLNGWNPTNYDLPDPIRNHLLVVAKYRCTSPDCAVPGGFEGVNPKSGRSVLTIDHIDGNADNNLRDNLRVLCPNCHSMTETYGYLNKGKGRTLRYQKSQ